VSVGQRMGPNSLAWLMGAMYSILPSITWYNIYGVHHNMTMEPSKFICPFIREEGLRHQDHLVMNAQVLSNLLAQFCRNEHTAIARAKKHTNLEWDRI
jgi:hypothetical protein